VRSRLTQKIHAVLEQHFPEKRLFLRSDTETRFIRLKSETQLFIWAAGTIVVAWTIFATAILLMDSIGAGSYTAQAVRNQADYEYRLNALSDERDLRANEAAAAQARFATALSQISAMQSELLNSEDRRRELETGIEVIQATLRRTMQERQAAREQAQNLTAELTGNGTGLALGPANAEMTETVDILTSALADTAAERDKIAEDAEFALTRAADMELELRLLQDKNDEIFSQLEAAMQISVEPLDRMFRNAGMDPETLLSQVRRGYSGTGGPLTPLQFSTRGGEPDPETLRANAILSQLDNLNLYRIAAEKLPLGMPVNSSFRYSSNYGSRWGRMHEGQDMAAPIGTPIYATADGVVRFAGWSSGYGRLIKIRHEFGIETRYGHLNVIRVQVGQKVSRGERIGDMGNSGRSTGPHLHYEVRVGGKSVNPMTYLRAGQDVF
jgi:murein DD-endopeptidase MepM/ murein hydrolase activator NlpD